MDDPTDEALVRRHLAGDRSAFPVLVERHQRRVYNLAYRMLGRPEDADDATQDAFIACLEKLQGFRGASRFTTWLHRVALNICFDSLRRRKREQPADGEDPPEVAVPDRSDEIASAIDVQHALMRVPEEFRAPMVMHDVQGVPYEEIAESIGAPIGTVKSRIHRGRVALARAVRGEHAGGAQPSNREDP